MTGSLVDLSKEFKNGYKWDDLTSSIEERDSSGGLWGGFSHLDLSLDGEVIVLGSSDMPGEGGYRGYTPAGELQIYKLIENQLTKIGSSIKGEKGKDTLLSGGPVDVNEQIGAQFSLSGNGEVLAVVGRGANNPSTGEKDDARISIYEISDKNWSKTATIWASNYKNFDDFHDIELNYDGDLIYCVTANGGQDVEVFINNNDSWHKFTNTKSVYRDFSILLRGSYNKVNTDQIEISGDGKTLAIKGNAIENTGARKNGVAVYRIENPNISSIGDSNMGFAFDGFELEVKELGQIIDSLYYDKYDDIDPTGGWRTNFALSNDGNRLAISEAGLGAYGIYDSTRIFQLENDDWVEMSYENQVIYSKSLSFSSDGEKLISGNVAYKFNNEKWEQIGNDIETSSLQNDHLGSFEAITTSDKLNSKISPDGEYAALLVNGYAENLSWDTFYYSSDSSSTAYPGALYLYNLLENDVIKPTILTPSENTISISENQDSIYTFTADESVIWSLNTEEKDSDKFIIDPTTGLLKFLNSPDYESPIDHNSDNIYEITLRATDLVGNYTEKILKINITDVSEPSDSEEENTNTNTKTISLTGQFEFKEYSESGDWKFSYISLGDKAGNYITYDQSTIENTPSNISVTGKSDSNAPSFETISFSSTTVDTSIESSRTVDVNINNITDDLSGIDSVYITYVSPSGNNYVFTTAEVTESNNLQTSLTGQFEFKEYSESGDWKFSYITLGDKAGNYLTYDQSTIENTPSNISVTGKSDSNAPSFETISFSSTTVDTSIESSRTVDVNINNITDDLSGIDSVYITYVSPSGNNYISTTAEVTETNNSSSSDSSSSDSSSSDSSSSDSSSVDSFSSSSSTQIKVADVNASYIEDSKGFASITGSTPVTVTSYEIGEETTLDSIKDYDGNLHAGDNLAATASSYKYQGMLDVNGDGVFETIFTNKSSKRWVTAKVDSTTGQIDFDDNGAGGGTRVVGIYADPLIAEGENNGGYLSDGVTPAPANFGVSDADRYVVVNGETIDRLALNSQVRFQNDLEIDNLQAKHSGDYDEDGIHEVYWKTADGTAYLRSLMHADGNIRYANYQSEEQMKEYLTANGDDSVITDITS